MDFKIHTTDSRQDIYTGDARYLIDEKAGIVTVYAGGQRIRYGPAGWTKLEDAYNDKGDVAYVM